MNNSYWEWSAANGETTVPTGLSEHQEQVMVVRWLDSWASKNWPHLATHKGKIPRAAIPNGANRDAITGKNLKEEGVSAGFPDLFLPVPLGGFHGLFIEMKQVKKSAVSPTQDEWLNVLYRAKYKALVCRGHQAAILELCKYFDLGATK